MKTGRCMTRYTRMLAMIAMRILTLFGIGVTKSGTNIRHVCQDSAMAREKEVQGQIIALLKRKGAWYVKVHQEGRGRKGIPDLVVCYRGLFLAIEVKGDSGHSASPYQIKELRAIREADGYAIIAHSAAEVERLLNYIDGGGLHPQPPLPTLKVVSL